MLTGFTHSHVTIAIIFMLFFGYKVALLLLNKKEQLAAFRQKTKIVDMILGALLIITGVSLMVIGKVFDLYIWVKVLMILAVIPLGIISMKKENKMLAVLAFVLLLAAYGLAESMSPSAPEPEQALLVSGDATLLGKEIYTSRCQVCHGADGKGIDGAKNLQISMLSKEEMIALVTKGKNTMPAFKSSLTEPQIEAVVDYVRTLKP
jgi:mono/diheme cytochrome c family protein